MFTYDLNETIEWVSRIRKVADDVLEKLGDAKYRCNCIGDSNFTNEYLKKLESQNSKEGQIFKIFRSQMIRAQGIARNAFKDIQDRKFEIDYDLMCDMAQILAKIEEEKHFIEQEIKKFDEIEEKFEIQNSIDFDNSNKTPIFQPKSKGR